MVTGNVKFDVTPPSDTAARAAGLRGLFAGRFVFLCASTREGEEVMLLDALADLELPDLLVVLVPRHPQRFEAVADLLRARSLPFARRSAGQPISADTRVFLGDSMGEMGAYYAAADLCYVGGSLLPMGGQNMIEAAAAGCPGLIGPHTWNFLEAAEQAVARGAARRVADAAELRGALLALHDDPQARREMAQAGRAFAQANRGATERILGLIQANWPDLT
jgi:3-deoxy-D-manno-octulosonic-acid transferase